MSIQRDEFHRAIDTLSMRIDRHFDRMNDRVAKSEDRIAATERDIVYVKTTQRVASAVFLTLLGLAETARRVFS